MPVSSANPIILYDGVCGLCNRFIQMVLKRDPHDRFRFASLQNDFAGKVLHRHGAEPGNLDTLYVVLNYNQLGEQLLSRSDAAMAVLRELGGIWRLLEIILRVLPKRLRDWSYRVIARNRYRIFGKYDQCLLPEERYRHKFLDM
ncbi:MAG: DCC1-like thiol-disulfide oxidoreductase family protein [Terriglobales bacterium]|jgi:predicted DCC family thiol-disulfide oxidoreductase YuxK